MPEGTEVKTVYDRSDLIHRAIETLKSTLLEESLIVAAVCFLFLLHMQKRAGRHPHVACWHPHGLCADAHAGTVIQHHEPWRHRHCHWRHGGCGHRHDRKCPQALGAGKAGYTAHRHHCGCREGSGTGPVLRASGHHRVVHADLHAGSAGGPIVQATGLHQDLCHGVSGDPVDHAGACLDVSLHPRAHHRRAPQPRQPRC